MDLDDIRLMKSDGAAVVTAGIAAQAVRNALGNSAARPLVIFGGKGRLGFDKLSIMSDFVRQNATAPAEALFLHAGARGVHAGVEAGYLAADLADRLGFETFRMMLLHLDKALDAEEARLLDAERQARASIPIPAAALSIDQEDTILEQLEDPLAVHKDRVLAEVKNDAPAQEAPAATGSAATEQPAPAPEPADAPAAPAQPGGQEMAPLAGASGLAAAAPEATAADVAPQSAAVDAVAVAAQQAAVAAAAAEEAAKADAEAHARVEADTGIAVTAATPAASSEAQPGDADPA